MDLGFHTAFKKLLSTCFFWIVLVLSAGTGLATEQSISGQLWFTTNAGTVEKLAWDEGKFAGDVESVASGLESPFKLVANPETRQVAVAVGAKETPGVILIDAEKGTQQIVPLAAEISDLTPWGEGFVVAASKGRFYYVGADGSNTEWNARKEMSPPGRKGEFLLPLPDQEVVLVSFQKDDDDSEAKGNRLLVLRVDPLRAIHDLPLPRSHPELHRADDLKEQGPGPEIVLASQKANTVLLTADLYGALAFADLDAALDGSWKNFAYVSTSANGEMGTTFPDRATLLEVGGREYALISNASVNGGLVLFDVAKRVPVQFFPASAGADPPLFFPDLKLAATVISGKQKPYVAETEGERKLHPGSQLLLFDFSGEKAGEVARMRLVDMGGETLRIALAGEAMCAVFIKGKEGAEVLLVNLPEGNILDRRPITGLPVRVAARQ